MLAARREGGMGGAGAKAVVPQYVITHLGIVRHFVEVPGWLNVTLTRPD
jgi:hypothetical protein